MERAAEVFGGVLLTVSNDRFLVILKMTDERQRQVLNKDRLRGDLQI